MSRFGEAFAAAKREGRAALVTYLCAGDPDLERSFEAARAVAGAGADVIELGIPFSDPIADGPVIQAAAFRALASGTNVKAVLALVERLRAAGVSQPIALMTYVNPIQSFGLERFASECARVGVDGWIIPDLPLEQAEAYATRAEAAGLELVLLAAPTTPPARLERIARRSKGFLYFVSVAGVTGARTELPKELGAQVAAARALAAVPVAVGFGIATAEQVRSLVDVADGVVVGSALVKRLLQDGGEPSGTAALVRELRAATKRG